jgi:hypothetical protein
MGVVYLLSTVLYYNLTSYRQDAIDVAIPRKAKMRRCDEKISGGAGMMNATLFVLPHITAS